MMSEHLLCHLFQCLNGNYLTLLGSDTVDINLSSMSESHSLRTVTIVVMMFARSTTNKPLELEIIESLEEVLVVDFYLTFLESLIRYPYVLIVITYLVGMRIQTTVRSDDTITVEVIVRCRITSVVASESEDLLTCDLTLITHTLIYEVPDISTLIYWIFADKLPVLLETTHGVTHSVGILTLDKWLDTALTFYLLALIVCSIAFRIVFTVLVIHIHRTEDIGFSIQFCTLILTRTAIVVSLHPVVSLLEVRTIASLVAKTPHDD